jgi:arylsulfatase A-like enzyme
MRSSLRCGQQPDIRGGVISRRSLGRSIAVLLFGALAVTVGQGGAVSAGGETARAPASPRPNVIVILTDDEDWKVHGYMPRTRRLLHEAGTTFSQYLVTYALCCPSRASLLRGQYPHNTGVVGNLLPDGGYLGFVEHGDESSTLATWLQSAGYYTVLAGKYLNGYDTYTGTRVPQGWSDWHALLGHVKYFDVPLSENGRIVRHGHHAREYQTDLLRSIALSAIDKAAQRKQPLFLYIAPSAPHLPAEPAPRHAHLFEDVSLPEGAAYDEDDVDDKPPMIRARGRLSPLDSLRFQQIYRHRLQAMQAVDEMVEAIVDKLQAAGELDNTYIVYTSDNGWHMGEHRLHAGKNTAYEEDIRLPLVIRGPGVPAGKIVPQLALNIDLAPTIAELAHVAAPSWVDGRSLVPLWSQAPPPTWRKCALVQRSSNTQTQSDDGDEAGPEWGFRALRTDQYTYVDWTSGDWELYDLLADPAELHNLVRETDPAFLGGLQQRVTELGTCKAAQCRTLEDRPIARR